jgi:hypothetical protein
VADDYSNIKYEHINEEEIANGALDAQAIEAEGRRIAADYECKVIQALVEAGDNNLAANLEGHHEDSLVAAKEVREFTKATTTPKKQIDDGLLAVRRQFLINAATNSEQQHAAAKAVAVVRKEAGLPYSNFDSNMRQWAIRARIANQMLSKLPKPADPEPEARTNSGNPQSDAARPTSTTTKSTKKAAAKKS